MHKRTFKEESFLVASLSKGNILAFNELYYSYSPYLYRFALGYLKSESEAEELVQEVFTIIWEKHKLLKKELSFKSFLFTIAFNIIRKHFRTKAYLNDYIKNDMRSDEDLQTVSKISYDSMYNYIKELVSQLPVRRKDIFVKSRFEGMSIKEIAKLLNISHKTVENQLAEALRFLRNNIDKENIPVILFFSLFIL